MKKIYTLLFLFTLSFFSCGENNSDVELLNGNSVTSFKVLNNGFELIVTVDGSEINVLTPYNLTSTNDLSFDYSISEGATITPNPSNVTSLTEPFKVKITAENGEENFYTINFIREQSPENSILNFSVKNNNEESSSETIEADIDEENSLISKELPKEWNLDEITATISISDFATISPDPSTINDYTEPVTYTITSEDGTTKDYTVNLTRELYSGKDILSFTILHLPFTTSPLDLKTDIDQENGIITQKISPLTDIKQLIVNYTISEKAIIIPDPKTIVDYSEPVTFIVIAENNERREYVVNFEKMEQNIDISCDISNVSKWFGGDDRGNKNDPEYFHAPRNVGTGQFFTPEKDIYVSSYKVRFSDYFYSTDENGDKKIYFGKTTIRLAVRNSDGEILATIYTTFNNPMESLWTEFNLASYNIVLKKDNLYYFSWYLDDGENLGIHTGSLGYDELHSGPCAGTGLYGTSTKREETSLEDWSIWEEHHWHFNFRLSGME